MKLALNRLGYKTFHSAAIVMDAREADLWQVAMAAKFDPASRPPLSRAEWDAMLGQWSAVSADAPACSFAPELIAAYPDAKVVLVARDVDRWYASFVPLILEGALAPSLAFCGRWLDPPWLGRVQGVYDRWARGALAAENRDEMRARAKDVFRAHYEEVRRVTPPERLLEYRMGDGWEPLCKFLGKEVPDEPFPHVNDAQELPKHFALWKKLAVLKFSKRVGPWVVASAGVAAAVWWKYSRH